MAKQDVVKTWAYPSPAAEKRVSAIANRELAAKAADVNAVRKIIAEVRKHKDRALLDYVNRFDAPGLPAEGLAVTKEELNRARKQVSRAVMASLTQAAENIEAFHRDQIERSWFRTSGQGVVLGQMVTPVDAAGVYVPGGRGGETPLVSSVLMGCIPAKIAGVERICITTPPTKTGEVNPHLLAAAQVVGVDRIYKAGSAWGIAALAYGTETVPRVDVIVGPGNIYVTLAKKLVAGTVGIDMVAGPSEILIIADEHAIPAYVAADLLSQAEHDRLASSVLLTSSEALAQAVCDALCVQLQNLPRRSIAEASLAAYGAVFVVPDLEKAFELANRMAPEHLELHLDEPFQYLGRVRNAGAVFMGPYTPEPVGDYFAGPNHVLPTAGTARFASALSVGHFLKKTSVVYYGQKAFKQAMSHIVRLAETEGLGAHAQAVRIRDR